MTDHRNATVGLPRPVTDSQAENNLTIDGSFVPSKHYAYTSSLQSLPIHSNDDSVDETADENDVRPEGGGEGNTLGWFGRLCERIGRLPLLARYIIYILPLAIALAICIIVMGTGGRRAGAGRVRLIGLFIWLETVWLALWISNLIAKTLPLIFRFFSSLLSAPTRRYSNLITAVETPITLFIWSIIAWASVPLLYAFPYDGQRLNVGLAWNAPGSPWTQTARRVLLATIPVTAVYLVEKLIVQWVSIDYHETQFAGKIAESTRWIDMVTELYKLSLNTFPEDCGEFAKEDSILRKTFKSNKNHRHGTSHISRSMGWARTGAASIIDTFAEMVLHHKRLSVSPERAVVVAALDNKLSIEVLAQRLWKSLAQAGADDVYEEDIARLFGHDRREEAEALFLKLDCNRNAAVSLQEMIGMLDDMARERGSMSKTMTDVKSSIDTFSAILAVAGLVGIALIYAAFFTENFARNFMAVTTAVLSLSFAFASTVQEFAASFLFLFVQHPFDVGDRCQVGNEEELIVEKICLLHTVFRDVKDNRLLQIPNRISSTLKIKNISRSRAMKERINIMVNANTTADDIKSLQIGLSDFVSSPAARRDYRPGVTVDITAIDDFASLNLIIVYGHKSNWSNESLRLKRRNRFMAEILAVMRRIPIIPPGGTAAGSGSLTNPQYTVELSAAEARAALEKSRSEVQGMR